MKKIVLLGGSENHLRNLFMAQLTEQYLVTEVSLDGIRSSGQGEECLLISFNEVRRVLSSDTIVVLQNHARISKDWRIANDGLVIVNAVNQKQLERLAEAGIPAVTCGMSGKDTFTFSSKSEGRYAVSLQRSILLPGGRSIEPQEILLTLPPNHDDYSILAMGAVFILLKSVSESISTDEDD